MNSDLEDINGVLRCILLGKRKLLKKRHLGNTSLKR